MRKRIPWQGWVIPVIFGVSWYLLGHADLIHTGIFPRIHQVWEAIIFLTQRAALQTHLWVSLQRVLIGFATAGLIGVPIGLGLGWAPQLKPWFDPTLHFLRQIPPVAWIPLFIMWFGIGEASKNAVIFYAAFFPIMLNTQLGVEQIPRTYWEVADLYQFTLWKSLRRLVLPGSAPAIITGLRLGMGMSWRALVAAEMLAASSGLGYLIMTARSLVRLDEMVVGMLIIGVMGVAIDGIFALIASQLLPWTKSVSGVRSTDLGRTSYEESATTDTTGV